MMKIEISDEGIIFCNKILCNPIYLWKSGDACGDCPLIQWGEKFCSAYFEDASLTAKFIDITEK